jgi:hypothetical protein
MNPLQAHCRHANWADTIDILFFVRDEHGNKAVVEPLVLRNHEPGTLIEPTMSLSPDHAQKLMDELWDCGLRPTQGAGTAGAMAATERHLKDMQKLLGHHLGVTL